MGILSNIVNETEVLVESDDAVKKAIMASGKEPQDALHDLMSVDGPLGDYVRRSYEITGGENGLHGDDDHEEIFDRMVYDLGLEESVAEDEIDPSRSPWTVSGKHPGAMSQEELEIEIAVFDELRDRGDHLSPRELAQEDSLYHYLETSRQGSTVGEAYDKLPEPEFQLMKKSLLRSKWYLENEEMDPEMVATELRDVNAMLDAVNRGESEAPLDLDTSVEEEYMSLYNQCVAKLRGAGSNIYGVDHDVLPLDAKPNPDSPYNSGQVEENILPVSEVDNELQRIQDLVKFR